jgi:hypothetical protein
VSRSCAACGGHGHSAQIVMVVHLVVPGARFVVGIVAPLDRLGFIPILLAVVPAPEAAP